MVTVEVHARSINVMYAVFSICSVTMLSPVRRPGLSAHRRVRGGGTMCLHGRRTARSRNCGYDA